jgi:16S rRNA (cytidine1402-2'-O)-methyltransferase
VSCSGTLFVVATPLGNLQDISPRLQACLQQVHTVFAEDTRRSGQLLQVLGLKRPLRSLHAHNELHRLPQALELLAAGHHVAYLSDAGTPAVSDPGAALVAAAHAAQHPVSPIAGPSALTAALSVAGFGGGVGDAPNVLFLGFLSVHKKARDAVLQQVQAHRGCVVLFEAPHRLQKTLTRLATEQPQRLACLCRELTKVHEEIVRATLEELTAWSQSKRMQGEFTLVLGPLPELEAPPQGEGEADAASAVLAVDAQAALQRCLAANSSVRDAANCVAAIYGLPRRQIYAQALTLQAEDPP